MNGNGKDRALLDAADDDQRPATILPTSSGCTVGHRSDNPRDRPCVAALAVACHRQ